MKPQSLIGGQGARLRGTLIEALRPYLLRHAATAPAEPFNETPSTTNSGFFWQPGEVLAHLGTTAPPALRHPSEDEDAIDYRFDEPRAFYLRLLPRAPLPAALSNTSLMRVVEGRRLRVLSRTGIGGMPAHNAYGAIIYEPHGAATTPVAFSQLFRNGEIWGVTRALAGPWHDRFVVPMLNVQNFYRETLASYVDAARELGVPPPFAIEMGAVGLAGMCLSLPNNLNDVSDPVYDDEYPRRWVLNEISPGSQHALVEAFIKGLYDLVGLAA